MSTPMSTSATMKRSGSLRFDTGRLRRNIQKQFSRTREKIRGGEKSERNEDDDYLKKCEIVINRKQTTTVKLQTELKRHLKALKNVTASSRSLYETILEAYEDNWNGRKEFSDAFLDFDSYWSTYHSSLCTVMEHVTAKLGEFVVLKEKLEKRKRKMMDYNIVERNLREAMNTKRRDPGKLHKAERDVEAMRRAYLEVHNELSQDLPKFYDDHVHFCCENWSFLLENEKRVYDHLCSTISTFLSSVYQLRLGYQQQLYTLSGVDVSYSEISRSTLSLHYPNHNTLYNDLYEPLTPRARTESGPNLQDRPAGDRISRHGSSASCKPPSLPAPLVGKSLPGNRSHSLDDMLNADDDSDGYGTIDVLPNRSASNRQRPNGSVTLPATSNGPSSFPAALRPPDSDSDANDHVYAMPNREKKKSSLKSSLKSSSKASSKCSSKREEGGGPDLRDLSSNSPTSSLSSHARSVGRRSNASSLHDDRPAAVTKAKESLPMMISVHSYERQNDDELDLFPNDLVQILPWEDESLKEDGWLFGMKLPDGKKGLFPENHTEPYSYPT